MGVRQKTYEVDYLGCNTSWILPRVECENIGVPYDLYREREELVDGIVVGMRMLLEFISLPTV